MTSAPADASPSTMQIAILLFERVAALDAVGPYEVLSRLPGATVTFVAQEPGPKRTDPGGLALVADAALTEVSAPEVVLVPGGRGRRALMEDGPVHEWLRAAHQRSTWTTSVCTGALILAAAGLLRGRRATTHWLAREELRAHGAVVDERRVEFDGKIATAAGVSAGIDLALELAARIAGAHVAQAIQLGIEYDPSPPFDSGSPRRAPAEIVAAVRAHPAARAG